MDSKANHPKKEEAMSKFVRRDFLKAGAAAAAGAVSSPFVWIKDADAQWTGGAGEGSEAARAALEPLRAGRHRPVHGERQEVQREVRDRSARRQRKLGGRAAQGGGRRQHRRGAGHHPRHERRREPLSGEARRLAPISPTISARNTAAGTRCASSTCGPTARSGSGFPWVRPAA